MRKVWIGLALAMLTAEPVSAVELAYRWSKGDVHRFHYRDETRMSLQVGAVPGMGVGGMNVEMVVESDFAMRVLEVRRDGSAEVELVIHKLDLTQGGRKLPALAKLPPAACKVRAEVDRKGRATFHRMVTVYVQEDRVYLGVRKAEAGPHGAAASVSAGGPEGGVDVDLVAAIDPKTGRITASAKVRERPPQLRKVKIKERDPGIDILPRRIFEMMVLPDGELAPGGQAVLKTPLAEIAIRLDEMRSAIASLHYTTRAAVDTPAAPAAGDADEMDEPEGDEDLGGMPDMGSIPGMGGIPGMGTGKPAQASSAGGAGGLRARTDVHMRFDTGKGRLVGMKGDLGVQMSAAGMAQIDTQSRFTLERI
ncbi:MAG: hypothetical protein JXR96_27755 [Deltaproteobacteria bacterium]|nr:hypothetical protein [Deltaproteobacteria bacterium]